MRSIVSSALARAFSFLPIAVATLLTSRLVIQHYGVAAFDAYALMLTLIFLLPLNSLGVGAAVTASFAAEGADSPRSRAVVLTAARVLTVSTLVTVVVSLVLGFTGTWSTLLGPASGSSVFIGIGMAVYALSFVPGLSGSMLLGVHRNHVTILLQTFFGPLILLGTVVLIVTGAGQRALILVPTVAALLVAIMSAVAARRATSMSWVRVLRAVPARRRIPGASIRKLSGPVLISTIAVPIALQSDRIVLSHVTGETVVAQYTIMTQIIAPALALIAAASAPLFPMFNSARARGRHTIGIGATVGLFAGAALVVGAALAAVANPLAHLISGDGLGLGVLLPVSAGLLVVVSAMSYPVAANLMDPAGVRFVALVAVIALPVNLGLSIVLAKQYGAAGPMLATVIVGLVIQAAPGIVYSRRRERSGFHAVADPSVAPVITTVDGTTLPVDDLRA